ncbi:MAG TPA: restriction endonuclease subunit S [Acidobacteriaceae bacterium]|jgi:type I restriction enzyme S subunit|nr:restriction endonuclease subunit S [Acidobacteriaceae bacterium]
MANDWKKARLGDLVEIKHGWPFKSELFSETLTGKPIVMSIGNFNYTGGLRLDSTSLKEYRGEFPEEYVLSAGDILLVMTCQTAGGEILGIPARIPSDDRTYLHNQRLGKVIVKDQSKIDLSFLYWLFLFPAFNRELVNSATGTKILHTAPSRIQAFEFALPTLEEQLSIARILWTLEKKIELNRKMNETLEAMVRALFKSWFVDFDPVRAKAEGRDPGLPASVAALFPDSFEDRELEQLPNGWQQIPLYEIAEFSNGAAYRDMHFSPIGEGLPVIKIAELKAGVTDSTRFTTTELGGKYRIDQREILFSWSGNPDTSIDTFIWDGGPAWLNQHIFRVRENGTASRTWIYCLLKSLRPVFAEIARDKQTTGLGHVTIADMKRLMVCRPPPEVAKVFDTFAAPILERVFSNQLQINLLKDIRDNLLPRLISGDLQLTKSDALIEVIV